MQQTNYSALANMSDNPAQSKLSSEIERLVNRIFEQLLASCPSIQYWSAQQIATAKQQWILGFAENGIHRIDQVRTGMQMLRSKEDDFVPGIGKFIAWCKSGNAFAELGLPTAEELLKSYRKYRASFCDSPEEYAWQSAVEYHLVLQLQRAIYEGALNEEKTLQKAKALIETMAKRLQAGETVAEPKTPKLTMKTGKPISEEAKAEHIARMRAIVRGKIAHEKINLSNT